MSLVVVAFSLPVVHYSGTITDMPLEVEQIVVLMGLFSKRCAERFVFSVAFFSSPRCVIGLSFEFIQATNFIPPCLFLSFLLIDFRLKHLLYVCVDMCVCAVRFPVERVAEGCLRNLSLREGK